MIHDKTVAVVVPAYNEAKQIGMVIESVPDFVDRIIVVNDASKDETLAVAKRYLDSKSPIHIFTIRSPAQKTLYNRADQVSYDQMIKEMEWFPLSEVVNQNPAEDRVILINLMKNHGVGAAIARGYKWCKDHGIDCTCVMAGDGQMDPSELKSLCLPVIDEGIDYVKGNRLIHSSSWFIMPKLRYIGNATLSILTKIASGYWHVSDTQTGYTAISKRALYSIDLFKIYKRYGMPNDMLVRLNIAFCTIKEVGIKPVYGVGENTKMKIGRVIHRISWLLLKSFFKRLWLKYFFRDFHPLFLLYHMSFFLFAASIPFAINIIEKVFTIGSAIVSNNLVVFVFLIISGFQSLLFAMWMDIQDNERLYK